MLKRCGLGTTLQITQRSLGSTPGTLPKSFDPWGVKRLGVGLGPPRSGHKGTRTHLSLNKDAPISRAAERRDALSVVRSWADCTINMAGFDLR